MRNIQIELRALAGFMLMWTATSAGAGPVIYASADPATSKGTELYAIDPIAATITMVRGMGIGAGGGGTYGGAHIGGGYGSSSSGGGDPAGITPGDFSHFAPASLSGNLSRGSAPLATHSSDDPITAAVAPNTQIIDIAPPDTSMPAWLGLGLEAQSSSFSGSGRKSAGTPSPQFSPSIGCTGDCKDLFEDTLFAPSLIASCIVNCGEGVSSLAEGGVQISAVPEPGLLGLLVVGLATAGLARRHKMLRL